MGFKNQIMSFYIDMCPNYPLIYAYMFDLSSTIMPTFRRT